MVMLALEIDEWASNVGFLSAASRVWNVLRCVLPETAGYKLEARSVVAKVTTSAVVKLAKKTDASASDVMLAAVVSHPMKSSRVCARSTF